MKKKTLNYVLGSFLLGIFMGAIDTGIITPARQIIQNSFGVSRGIGMWVVTIYTLTYAISMPIVGKLADKYGRKKVYVYCIAIFALGSSLSGASNFVNSFALLLVARGIQAVGAGGIMPIATAVIGQSFSKEKRGMALGLVGAVYGVATIVGPTLGSSILSFTGVENWGWIFYINLPISIVIILLSLNIENSRDEKISPLDFAGGAVIAGTIGSLMYALTNFDFFHFINSLRNPVVYPYLIIFAVLIPVLIKIEQKAEDPVLNLRYFKNKQMLIVFGLALTVGIGMMVMVFIPQFSENILKIKPGTGGYVVTILAVFSGVAAPLSGRLIDKKNARFVLILGFLFILSGTLVMGYFVVSSLTFLSLLLGLGLTGFGVGFTVGAPLNYLILDAVQESEGATALATMSLIRAIGIAISPSLLIGFVVQAAGNLQSNLMAVLQSGFNKIMPGSGGMTAQMVSNPDATKAFADLKNSSVYNIVDRLEKIFKQLVPSPYNQMVVKGIEQMRGKIENIFQQTLDKGYTHMFTAAAIIAGIGLLLTLMLKKKGDIEPDEDMVRY